MTILPSRPDALDVASLSHPGRVRALNEDAVLVDREHGIAVLADGMGGHRAGEVASRMAVDIIAERLRTEVLKFRAGVLQPTPAKVAEQIINKANRAIFDAAGQGNGQQGMGTTLALVLFHDHRALLLHVGDSRIYRLHNGRLQLLTRDDSILLDQVELGLIAAKDAGESHNRHLVTQALGIGPRVQVHVNEEKACSGDLFLLCTDGLSDFVEDSEIELILESLKTNLPLAASHLVDLANDYGGYDNVTVALVRVRDEPVAVHRGWGQRLFGWLTASRAEK